MEHWSDYMKRNAITPDQALDLLGRWHDGEAAIGMLWISSARATVAMRTQVQRVSSTAR